MKTFEEYVKGHWLRRYFEGEELIDEIMRAIYLTGGTLTTSFICEYKDNLRAEVERILS